MEAGRIELPSETEGWQTSTRLVIRLDLILPFISDKNQEGPACYDLTPNLQAHSEPAYVNDAPGSNHRLIRSGTGHYLSSGHVAVIGN